MDSSSEPASVLPEPVWRARRAAHERRIDPWVASHLARRAAGRAHPVEDFLFSYYPHRPAALRRWHPGFGFALPGGEEYAGHKGYVQAPDGATVSAAFVRSRRTLLTSIRQLVVASASRRPHLACFGMHEWAMVYKAAPHDVRHARWPLRLGRAGTDAVVEEHRVACTHFDAYRFFTDAARPRNTLALGPADRVAHEQPGCLHAGMDLYKHAYRLSPMVPSELVADCFALARDIRELDMRASPYDLSDLGYAAVPVETSAGKREYASAQLRFAEQARPLRDRLVEETGRLLGV